jgi:hypothetical protein
MKRMSPRPHLWIDESIRTTDAKPGDVHVMIHQLCGINVVESAFDEV